MKSFFIAVLSLAMIVALTRPAAAIPIGATAPSLQITDWAKGTPVDLATLRSNKVAIVEFWATWCPPCRASIPHLTELQKKYPDQVVVIGISSEDAPTVKKFVAKMGEKMDYTVAVDGDQKTTAAYTADFGGDFGIPYAVVVDRNGMVAWSGSPFEGLDEALDSVVKRTYDVEKMKQSAALRKTADDKLEKFVRLASANDSDPQLGPLGKELVVLDTELGGIRPGEKFDPATVVKMIRAEKLANEYQSAVMDDRDPQTTAAILQDLQTNAPADFDLADFKEEVGMHKTFTDYYHGLLGGTNQAVLAPLAKKLEENKSKNAQFLTIMARTLLLDEQIKTPDTALAMTLAKDAVDASGGKDAAALDAYALSFFASGNTAKAIEWQKKAVAAASDDEDRDQMEVALKKYQDAVAK